MLERAGSNRTRFGRTLCDVYTDRNAIKIEDHGHKLKVKDGDQVVGDHIDYVVYGLGSEDLLTGPRGIMDSTILGTNTSLRPILDTSGTFSDPTTDFTTQQQSFLGWQDESGRFQVFGLAAENYAGVQGGRGFDRIAPTDPRVEALKNWVSGDVLTVGQLTYIRSAVRAANNYVPGSIEHRVDYSHADANIVRVHLAAQYPDLPENYASQFIGMIRRVRTGLGSRLPHGFTAGQVTYIEGELARKERQIRNGGTNTSTDANIWQLAMATELQRLTPGPGEEVQRGIARLDQT